MLPSAAYQGRAEARDPRAKQRALVQTALYGLYRAGSAARLQPFTDSGSTNQYIKVRRATRIDEELSEHGKPTSCDAAGLTVSRLFRTVCPIGEGGQLADRPLPVELR
jgi:hypothetical protein